MGKITRKQTHKCQRCGDMVEELYPVGMGRDWACLPCKMRTAPRSDKSGETLQIRATERDLIQDNIPMGGSDPIPPRPICQVRDCKGLGVTETQHLSEVGRFGRCQHCGWATGEMDSRYR